MHTSPNAMSRMLPILIASFPRSGTHLLMDAVRRNGPATRPRMRPLESIHESYLSLDRFWPGHHNPTSERNARRILAKAPRPLLKTHGLPGLPEVRDEFRSLIDHALANASTLYSVRDGRQVMCSYFASRVEADPASTPNDFDRFIREPDDAGRPLPRRWADHVAAWIDHPGTLTIRYEDLVTEPETQLRRIASHAGLELRVQSPALPRPISSTLQHRLARLLGNLESTNLFARLKIKPAEVFTPELDRFFMDHAGDTQRRLGYAESGSDASTPGSAPNTPGRERTAAGPGH